MLIVSEVALALVLLIGATLLLKSFSRVLRVQPGFDAKNLLSVEVKLPHALFPTEASQTAFYENFLTQLSAHPGVQQAAYADLMPLDPRGSDILFSIGGAGAKQQDESNNDASYRLVNADYFETLRIPLVRGRGFTRADAAGSEPVIVINRTMADMFWHGRDPIGDQIWVGKPMGPTWTEPAPRTIIGIAADVHDASLAEAPSPTMFEPYAQSKDAGSANSGDTHSTRSSTAGACAAWNVAIGAADAAGRNDANRGQFDFGFNDGRSLSHDSAFDFRRDGTADCNGGCVRRNFILRGAAHARDWRADGAGGDPKKRAENGFVAGTPIGRGGCDSGLGRVNRAGGIAARDALWNLS